MPDQWRLPQAPLSSTDIHLSFQATLPLLLLCTSLPLPLPLSLPLSLLLHLSAPPACLSGAPHPPYCCCFRLLVAPA